MALCLITHTEIFEMKNKTKVEKKKTEISKARKTQNYEISVRTTLSPSVKSYSESSNIKDVPRVLAFE